MNVNIRIAHIPVVAFERVDVLELLFVDLEFRFGYVESLLPGTHIST